MKSRHLFLHLVVRSATSLVFITLSVLMCTLYLSFGASQRAEYTAMYTEPIPSQNLNGQDALTFLQDEAILPQLTSDGLANESFIQTQKLQASDGARDDYFGISVAVSGDTMLVSAADDDVNGNTNQGSVYVFVHSGTSWTLQTRLTVTDSAPGDNFGSSVALSGDTALIGANNDVAGKTDQGSVYVFVRSGVSWTQQAKLLASDGSSNDFFGSSIALNGNTALIGAYLNDIGANIDQGSAYVFVRNGTTWLQQAQLTAPAGAKADTFGFSLALSGETALVGSRLDDIGAIEDQGSVHVFVRNGTTWTHQAQLTASDGAMRDYFGTAVALNGETALIGAYGDTVAGMNNQGSAYIFERNGTTWLQQAQLIASNGAANDAFGVAVALSEEYAIIGSSSDDVAGVLNQGSVYIFVRSGATWTQQLQFTGSDSTANDAFGWSLSMSGDTLLVGAPFADNFANSEQGTAFIFTRAPVISSQTRLTASDGAQGDTFGNSIALSSNTALIGAPLDDVGTNNNQGSVYVFVRSDTTWIKQAQLTASDGAPSDGFGQSVVLFGDIALVGVAEDDVGGNVDQGSVYVFVRNGTTWIQEAQLIASDGAAGDQFGASIALNGEIAIIGAPANKIDANLRQGSAYLFVRNGATWTQQAQLTASDGAGDDEFGISVAINSQIVLVGAWQKAVGANIQQGLAYVFVREGDEWIEKSKLIANDGDSYDLLGVPIVLDDDTALIGTGTNDDSSGKGAVYVFVRNGTNWMQQAQLVASDSTGRDGFGRSLDLSDNTALIGWPRNQVNTIPQQGSAYVFTRSDTTWKQQTKLVASDGAISDFFGNAVALDGNTGLIGAYRDDISSKIDQGSSYFFDKINQIQFVFLPLVLR